MYFTFKYWGNSKEITPHAHINHILGVITIIYIQSKYLVYVYVPDMKLILALLKAKCTQNYK